MGQVQKFADRWIITGLEITTRETMHASVLKISWCVINLFLSVPYSLIISQVVSLKTQIYTQSPSTDLTRGHYLCSGD